MALNPNIALGVRGVEVANPLAQYAQISQLQSAQNQNALAQYQLATAQREQESTNALNEAYRSAYNPQTGDIDINTLRKTLSTGGFGSKLPGLEKTLGELQAQKLTQQKLQGEITAQPIALQIQQANLVDTKLKQSRAFLDTINPSDPNAPQQYFSWFQANHADPILGPTLKARGITEEQFVTKIQQAMTQGPQAFAQLLNQSKLGTEKFMELNKPTTQVIDQSGQRRVLQIPGLGGAPISIGTYEDVPLPGPVQNQKIQIAQQSRPPAQPVAPTITQIIDPTNPNQMISVDARRYQGGGVGSPGVIGVGGKEPGAAIRVNKAEEGKTQLANDLDNLRSSFTELDRLRAIPSTERNVISNLMSAAQASGVGQVLGRAGGSPEQVERDVINSARQRLVASIKNATGMSSKSLDSNMELQTMLRSISDPGQSVEAALRIIDDIENAYVKGSGMLPKRDQPGAAGQGTSGFKYLGKESK